MGFIFKAYSAPFEFVLLDGSKYFESVVADSSFFLNYFKKAPQDCTSVAFENLGGDALLVAPCPLLNNDDNRYTHLAAFVRHAEASQVSTLPNPLIATLYLKAKPFHK